MAVSQYSFTYKELAEVLVKSAGVHEGKWLIAVNFGFSPGYFGPNPKDAAPGVIIAANQIMLQRVVDGQPPPEDLVVDASVVNPKKV